MHGAKLLRPLLVATLAVLLATGGSLLAGQVASAQDASSSSAAEPADAAPADVTLTADQLEADRAVWKRADCSSCHGWSGNGHDTGPIPPGPSLRDTQLDLASIRETVQCGRPGTNMPSHDRLAYTDTRCYGMTSADVGHGKPQKGTPLQAKDLDAVAAYVAGYLKGRGAIDKAECETYWGAGNALCATYQ